jgi:hypothetical protein
MLVQLLAYGILWIIFPLAIFCAAHWRGWRGALLAHLAFAAIIIVLDMSWSLSNGLQSQQTPFGIAIAIALRATLANLILLPVSFLGLKSHRIWG